MKNHGPAAREDFLVAASVLLFPGAFWDRALATYVLPFAVAAAAVLFVIWRMHGKDVGILTRQLEQAQTLLEQRERERDLAQEELFRRLYEERELNKEKTQFQAQLAEYENTRPWPSWPWAPPTRSTILCSASSPISNLN